MSGNRRKTDQMTRRELLGAASLAGLGTAMLSGSAVSAQQPAVQVGKDPGQHEPIPDFKFDLENSKGSWTGEAGSAREATLAEFPVSQYIAGVSMRLKPGDVLRHREFRERGLSG